MNSAKLSIFSLVKDARNAFLEKHGFQFFPCFRSIELVNPLAPMIVLRQTRTSDTLADSTDGLKYCKEQRSDDG
jgi:hypothetical protein